MQFFKGLFFSIVFSLICSVNAYQITVIPTDALYEQSWQQLKDLFEISFLQAYKHIDIKDINSSFNTTSDYLQSLFDADRKSINALNFDIILATQEQEILGYMLACYCGENKTIYIHHLAVDTSKHQKGIGKALVKYSEHFYKDADRIALSTRRFNVNAIGFYKHIGFYEADCAPEIAYVIRPAAKNNPQILNLEKIVTKN